MTKILANDGIDANGKKILEDAGFTVITEKIAQENLLTELNNFDAILVRSATKVRKELIDACPNLKLVGRGGVGMDNIDVEYAKNKGIKVDIHQIEKFKVDEACNNLLVSGNTTGCFYIESPAMRMLIRKLLCDNYLTLVAASSVIRPGVARSGMMSSFIERHRQLKTVDYLHPIMKEQLQETYGVMVYQEDVLKIAHHFGGLDLSDADVLRRMMSGKSRNQKQFEDIEAKFFTYCETQKYPEGLGLKVWKQIESFAGYSFAKGHSASYAGESYQSLYLKAYYPLEFIVAVINNFGGFYGTRIYVNEARKLGGTIHLPCVNKSIYTTMLYDSDIYLGFIHIKSLGADISHQIVYERETNGVYTSL